MLAGEMRMQLELTKDGKSVTVVVDRGLWSCHPKAGTVPTKRMKAALRRVGAKQITEVTCSAPEVWAYHGGYFVAWETAAADR